MSRPPAKRIPVNIITGGLGVGKTTAIRSLLQRKPGGEHWAVIVNEFGVLGVEEDELQTEGDEFGGITNKQVRQCYRHFLFLWLVNLLVRPGCYHPGQSASRLHR